MTMRFSQNWEMPNGASVGDWLGTASVAAYQAAKLMDEVRASPEAQAVIRLEQIDLLLTQAIDELHAIRAEVGEGSP